MSQRPKSETFAATNARQTSPKSAETLRIYVKDAAPSREEPLSAFMVPSKYVSPPAARAAQPKRPLNPARTPEKVKMYSQIGALDAAYRIRRPRTTIPVADISSKKDEAVVQLRHLGKRIAGFAVAIFAFAAAKSAGAWGFITDTAHGIFQVGSKTKYSAASGAAVRKFGMPRAWFRTSAALAALLIVFGLGILGGWFSNNGEPNGGNGTPNGADGGANGNAVIQVQQVQPSSDESNGQTGTSTPQTTGAPASGAASSNSVQSSSGSIQGSRVTSGGFDSAAAGSTAPVVGGVGGRGGGDGGTSAAPTTPTTYVPSTTTKTTAPSSGSSSSAPPPSSGGSTPPPSGGGGGSSIPKIPSVPAIPSSTIPDIPDIPSGDCICGTLQQAPQTVNTTEDSITGIIPKP